MLNVQSKKLKVILKFVIKYGSSSGCEENKTAHIKTWNYTSKFFLKPIMEKLRDELLRSKHRIMQGPSRITIRINRCYELYVLDYRADIYGYQQIVIRTNSMRVFPEKIKLYALSPAG